MSALRARLGALFQGLAVSLDPGLGEPAPLEDEDPLLPISSVVPIAAAATSPEPGPELGRIADSASQLMETARDDVLGRIQGVNQTSEREVLAVGSSLQLIVNEAQAQVKDLRQTLEELTGSKERVGVPQLAARQSHAVRDYLERMSQIIAAHDQTVKGSEAASQRIADIGRSVEKVAFQARLLSFNAAIEAARLGGQGSAFGVLAEEMTRLSTEMDAANRQVRDLAQTLLGSMPEIGRQSTEIRDTSAAFSEQMRQELEELEQSSAEFEQRTREALTRGDERTERVVQSSREALSHLSFQDACAQRLLSVDAVLRRLASSVLGTLADPRSGTHGVGFADIQRSDEHFAGEVVALRAPGESDGDAAAAPGEMMLF
ncbi:MAG: methyl-accepting chemotaxis protein [Myxococcales bacterium]|nr:MAG: methyl-accepting chemotaxis protein [Myxococcales bacterium]